MNIQIPYDAHGLDPRTAEAFEEVLAPLQTWFNGGKIEATSYGTFKQPQCRYFLQANQSIPNNTDTDLLWTAVTGVNDAVLSNVQYDNGTDFGAAFLPATSTSYLIPPIPGTYLAIAGASFAANATGRRDLWIQQRDDNGATFDIASSTSVHSNSAGSVTNLTTTAIVVIKPKLTIGTGIRARVYQNSGGALNVTSGFSSTYLQLLKLS